MSTSTLFAEPTTPSTGPLANLEPHLVWLQRSTQPEVAAARRRVNAWYQDFPDPDGQLAAKLTSTRDEVYYVALDELYVHQALRRLEPDVRYEEGGQGPTSGSTATGARFWPSRCCRCSCGPSGPGRPAGTGS
jgi:hypothetical protein